MREGRDICVGTIHITQTGNIDTIINTFEKIGEEIAFCQGKGNIILQGDLNIHTKSI